MWILLEQNKFEQCLLSFDDSKVLKNQLDMLIFVQVYKTKDKLYNVFIMYLFLKNKCRAKNFKEMLNLSQNLKE